MSPRKVRRKYVRHLIFWGALTLPILGLGFIWPLIWWVAGIGVLFALAFFTIIFGIPCTVLAGIYFLKTGYWTNPMRHGPWGDWKGEM